MTEPTLTVLSDVARSVFADCAFLLMEPLEEEPVWPDQVLNAAIEFSGPFSGRVCLTAGLDLLRTVASDMLALELDDPEVATESTSALAELSNVVAGVLVAKLFGTSVVCALGLPRVEGGFAEHASDHEILSVVLADELGRNMLVELAWPHGMKP